MLEIDRAKVEVPYKARFWGADYTCAPRFVEESLGDGNQLVAITPLNTRPNYYLIRVDSSWHTGIGCCGINDECPDLIAEHLDEIYDAIEDEYGEKDRYQYANENDLEEGAEPFPTDWPVLSLDSGCAWSREDPAPYLMGSDDRRVP